MTFALLNFEIQLRRYMTGSNQTSNCVCYQSKKLMCRDDHHQTHLLLAGAEAVKSLRRVFGGPKAKLGLWLIVSSPGSASTAA